LIKKIPKEILHKYRDHRIYVRFRWRFCPYEQIESLAPKGGTILDFGCGCGMLANLLYLRNNKRKIIGIDSSIKRIEVAKKSNSNITFLLGKAEDFKVMHFDASLMTDFLHHINYEAQVKLLKEIHKRLNKNGLLIIQDIENKPFGKYIIVWLADHFLNPGKRAYYRKAEEMVSLLSKTGFHVEIIKADKGLPLSDIIYLCRKL
jgi:2-polyprenyl-3-methyl-5-hydroxy-6-metoxy-1,4-benzoquinol methylase